MPRPLLFLLLLLPLATLAAQDDLRTDSAFFHSQKEGYQRWLEFEGMGNVLRVQGLEVDSQRLDLYLAFTSEDTDTVAQLWRQLKLDFEVRNAVTLEQHLFYKMAQLMEVEEGQARIALYDTYDPGKGYCFLRGIFFEDGQVRVHSENCKSEIRDLIVERPELHNKSQVSETSFSSAVARREVFDKVYAYVLKRYGGRLCEGAPARVFLRERDQVLRFEVKDLCKEVITESRAPLVCQWLPIDCKERREWLTFTITYLETPKGFKLTCTIDGKVGSGYFGSVGRGAFYDMEIDFEPYLKDYADSFKLELQQLF